MLKKIFNEIKSEWKKNKLVTGFMGIIILLALLTYLKPASTSGILNYIGLSIVNFCLLSLILVIGWWFYMRKRRK